MQWLQFEHLYVDIAWVTILLPYHVEIVYFVIVRRGHGGCPPVILPCSDPCCGHLRMIMSIIVCSIRPVWIWLLLCIRGFVIICSFTNLSHHGLRPGLGTDSTDFMTGPFLLSIWVFLVSSLLFFYLIPYGLLSWLFVSFWAHVNIVYRIVI